MELWHGSLLKRRECDAMKITRDQYLENSSELHNAYYAQFVTDETLRFVSRSLDINAVREAISSGDQHLNTLKIPFNNMGIGGGWWWDESPINLRLARELGEVDPTSYGSPSTRTCIGKAAARILELGSVTP